MFKSTVRKCPETSAFIRLASVLLPIVLVLVAAQLAYPQSPPVATIIQGQLTYRGLPVANAMVQWSFLGVIGQTATSDAAGNFAFEFPLSIASQIQIVVTANLYTPTQITVLLTPGTTTQAPAIVLTRKPSGQYGGVSGVVRNTSGLIVPNAAVSILGAGDLLTTTTDATGKFQFKSVGFNSNLTLQAATANSPCIVTALVPFILAAPHVTVNVKSP